MLLHRSLGFVLAFVACGGTPAPSAPPSATTTAAPATKPAGPDPYTPPPDTYAEDAKLPRGTVVAELRDGDDKPIAGHDVALAWTATDVTPIPHMKATTNAGGTVTFHAAAWRGQKLRVVSVDGPGTYFCDPFVLPASGGARVVLHRYPTTDNIDDALVAFQAIVAIEGLAGGELRVRERLRAYNIAPRAWVPELRFLLPEAAHEAFGGIGEAHTSMRIDVDGSYLAFRGTVLPGSHEVEAGWYMYARRSDVVRVWMPPHLAGVRVMVSANERTRVNVDGFPAGTAKDADGQHWLVLERNLRRADPPLEMLEIYADEIAEETSVN